MVTIVGFEKKRSKNGGSFLVLTVEGGVKVERSESTGNWFAQTLKTNILASMDEATAKALIGSQLPGKIVKKRCSPYTYVIPNTGEERVLEYTYEYVQTTDDNQEIKSEQLEFAKEESPLSINAEDDLVV
jgi:hypothetical protein